MAEKKSVIKEKIVVEKKSTIRRKPVGKKKYTRKRVYARRSPRTTFNEKTKILLVENFVGLQKVVLDLSTRMDSLVIKMDKLLSLFESSAESLVRKNFEIDFVKKKKPLIKEEIIRQSPSFERERSSSSNNLLIQPNPLPEFQRIQSNSPNPSYSNFQKDQNNYADSIQNVNPNFQLNKNNPISPQNAISNNNFQNFGQAQNNFDGSNRENFEKNSNGLPSLPESSPEGEIPGSGEVN